jgi:hypothetical protein
MHDLGVASDDDVILAWLQAEIESPGFQAYLAGDPPNRNKLDRGLKLAQMPDLGSPKQNAERRHIIEKAHGFGRGALTFVGLANDIVWRQVRVSMREVGQMLYANRNAAWTTLAPKTRSVAEGAGNAGLLFAGDDTNMHVLGLAGTLCHTDPVPVLPAIICLRGLDGRIIVMEGHTRATAFVIEAHRFPDGVDAYLGETTSIANWAYL